MEKTCDLRSVILVFFIISFAALGIPAVHGLPNGTESLITTDTVDSSQSAPGIYTTMIVWEDYSMASSNIRLYDLATGSEFPLLPDESLSQTAPDISDDYVVWQQRDTGTDEFFLVAYNRAAHSTTSIDATTKSSSKDEAYPRIYHDRIVWQDYTNGNWDIFLYNLTTGVTDQIVTGPSDQKNPGIYDNSIVYENWSGTHEIWIYSIPDRTAVPVAGLVNALTPAYPDISRDFLVWQDKPALTWKIFCYDRITGMTSQVTPSSLTTSQNHPRISGNRVVLEDHRRGAYADVYAYDLTSGMETWLSPNMAGADQLWPGIDGERIVWEDTRSPSGATDIYLFTSGAAETCPVAGFTILPQAGGLPLDVTFSDASTGSPILHRVWNYSDGITSYPLSLHDQFTTSGTYQAKLTVGNLKCRNSTPNICRYQVFANSPPVAGFTATPLSGLAPLTVRFSDSSCGLPASWLWDFGDGTTSAEKNPVHIFTAQSRSYDISLTVNNTWGGMVQDTATMPAYIRTLVGATGTARTPVEGITVTQRGGSRFLIYNAAALPGYTRPSGSVLIVTDPPPASGWQNITFVSQDSAGFSDTYGNNSYMGNISGAMITTSDVTASGTSPTIGTGWGAHYRIELSSFPSPASVATDIWESTLPGDLAAFQQIVTLSNFIAPAKGFAFTTRLTKTGIPAGGNATIFLSVDRAWIGGDESNAYIVGYGTAANGNTYGGVFPARFTGTNIAGTLDLFHADVPDYFTTFSIAPLGGSGNPIQLVTLSVSSRASDTAGTTDSDTSSVLSGTAQGAPVAVQNPPVPESKSPPPMDPGKTASLYINANAVITQATVLNSNDRLATVTIGKGIIARDAGGSPLSSIMIARLPDTELPPVPGGSSVSWAGMSYEIQPDGATFSPAITVTFMNPDTRWGKDYIVRTYNRQQAVWEDLPTVYDPTKGTITAQATHFSCFALFINAPKEPAATPAKPVITLKAPQVTPAPPAPTAMSIVSGMLLWMAALIMSNIFLVVLIAVVCIGLAYWQYRKDYKYRF